MLLSHISENIPKTFYTFSSCSGLKPNFTNGEVAGIGLLKGVKISLCGIKSVDLTFDTLKILSVHCSYQETLQNGINFLKVKINI